MVQPLPDEPALQTFVALKRSIVIGQRATAVAHGVGVFAQNQRPVVFDRGDVLDDVGDGCIHRTDDVGDGFATVPALCRRQERDAVVVEERTHCSFVMERPGWIDSANPGSHSLVIDAVAAFVAQ